MKHEKIPCEQNMEFNILKKVAHINPPGFKGVKKELKLDGP
jgi:hypothetical protein